MGGIITVFFKLPLYLFIVFSAVMFGILLISTNIVAGLLYFIFIFGIFLSGLYNAIFG